MGKPTSFRSRSACLPKRLFNGIQASIARIVKCMELSHLLRPLHSKSFLFMILLRAQCADIVPMIDQVLSKSLILFGDSVLPNIRQAHQSDDSAEDAQSTTDIEWILALLDHVISSRLDDVRKNVLLISISLCGCRQDESNNSCCNTRVFRRWAELTLPTKAPILPHAAATP